MSYLRQHKNLFLENIEFSFEEFLENLENSNFKSINKYLRYSFYVFDHNLKDRSNNRIIDILDRPKKNDKYLDINKADKYKDSWEYYKKHPDTSLLYKEMAQFSLEIKFKVEKENPIRFGIKDARAELDDAIEKFKLLNDSIGEYQITNFEIRNLSNGVYKRLFVFFSLVLDDLFEIEPYKVKQKKERG